MGDTPARRLFAPPPEKSEEEKARIAATDHRCLTLCIGMLERVMGVRMNASKKYGYLVTDNLLVDI